MKPPASAGDDQDADHGEANRPGPRADELLRPVQGLRELVFFQMVPFVVFHDLPCVSCPVAARPR